MAEESHAPEQISTNDWTQNKRFIRTFASDAAALKGEKLDLFTPPAKTPVPEAPKDPLTQAIASANSDTIDLDTTPTFDPERLGAIPSGNPIERPVERLVGGSSLADAGALADTLAPAAPTPPPSAPPVPAPDSAARMHTYTSDFSQAVDAAHASPATVLAAEQDAGATRARAAAPSSGANRFYVIAAVALIALGAAGAYAAYRYASQPQTVAVTQVAPVRIFVDERAGLSGTGSTLAMAIEGSVQTPLAANAVRLLTLPNGTSTDSSVFSALQLPAPNILLRNISAPASIAGVVNVSGNQSPFFILGVASYGDTFSGMLSWEPTMAANLSVLFPPYPAVQTTVGTSTATSTTPVVATTFKDEVVANHDARVLRDSAGHTLIIYGYWDQNTLILARDEDAFTELVGRLANSRNTQ